MIIDNIIEIKLNEKIIIAEITIKCFLNDITTIKPIFEKDLKYPVVGRALINYNAEILNIETERIHNVYKDIAEEKYFIEVFENIKYLDNIEDIPIKYLIGKIPTYTVNNQIKYIN